MKVYLAGILIMVLSGLTFGSQENGTTDSDELIILARKGRKSSPKPPPKKEEPDKEEEEKKSEKPEKPEKTTDKKRSKISKSLASGREVHDLAFSLGYNIVETFGRIPYFNMKYDYFFVGSKWFAEADVGIGYFLRDAEIPLVHQGLYDNDLIINLDFTLAHSFGYSKIGYINKGSSQIVPFVLFGPVLVYQGGFFNPGGVLGIGSIMYPKKESGFTIHYGVKDKIYLPKVYTTKFVTHNIHLYLGIQVRLKD